MHRFKKPNDRARAEQGCGFNAFQMADESQLEEALASLGDFSEYYQGHRQPQPLFRRRV